jgi:hypothetical protein
VPRKKQNKRAGAAKKQADQPRRQKTRRLKVAKRTAYDAATKTAILEAAQGARKEGKTWKQAHEAATAAGYKGGEVSLMLFVRGQNKGAKPAGRRGRKPGRKPGRPAGTSAPSGLSGIEAMIGQEVQKRMRSTIEGIISQLQGML